MAVDDDAGWDLGMSRADRTRDRQRLVLLIIDCEQDFIRGVVLAEEAFKIRLKLRFKPVQRLQDRDGRQVCGVVSLRDLFAARISRPPQPRSAAS